MSVSLKAAAKALSCGCRSPKGLQGRVVFPEVRWSDVFPRWEGMHLKGERSGERFRNPEVTVAEIIAANDQGAPEREQGARPA